MSVMSVIDVISAPPRPKTHAMTEALFSIADVTPDRPANRRPDWLETILKAPPRRHPRITHWQPCNRCGLLILEGDSDDLIAFKTRVDPTPIQLDPIAEANAILQDRDLFRAVPADRPHAWKLHSLFPGFGVGEWSRNSHFNTVLPEHACQHGYLMQPLLAQEPDPTPTHPDDPAPF